MRHGGELAADTFGKGSLLPCRLRRGQRLGTRAEAHLPGKRQACQPQ
jgi:hypothetical protein